MIPGLREILRAWRDPKTGRQWPDHCCLATEPLDDDAHNLAVDLVMTVRGLDALPRHEIHDLLSRALATIREERTKDLEFYRLVGAIHDSVRGVDDLVHFLDRLAVDYDRDGEIALPGGYASGATEEEIAADRLVANLIRRVLMAIDDDSKDHDLESLSRKAAAAEAADRTRMRLSKAAVEDGAA